MVFSWKFRTGSLLFLLFEAFAVAGIHTENVWSWRCQAGKCSKVAAESVNVARGEKLTSKNVCKLTCGPYSILWPKPSGYIHISSDVIAINPNRMYFQTFPGYVFPPQTKLLLQELGQLFLNNVRLNLKGEPALMAQDHKFLVTISITYPNITTFTQDVDESYELIVAPSEDTIVAFITAATYIGAKHGTETLTQLIVYDEVSKGLVLPISVAITDKPAYPYRGLLLDTARNFYSVASIKRTLDAMAASKLNTFHWHITDSHSFPMELKKYPQLTKYGAYDETKVYTHEDIRTVVNYARVRGIRVVPEFDTPAHVGEGWSHLALPGDSLDDYVVCFRAEPWKKFCAEPPCGQLNPTSDKVCDVLTAIYKEMSTLFDSDLFHMGGDEVNMNCWNSTQSIVQWMAKKNLSRSHDGFHELWNIFQQKALQRLKSVNKDQQKAIIWTSSLTTEARLKKFLDPKEYIIQIWTDATDQTIANLIRNGFSVILSNHDALYLDCGFGAWIGEGNNWCSPYIGWQKIYENDPIKILANFSIDIDSGMTRKLVLGSEAAMWSEQVDDFNLDSRLWPRVAALAERLWSSPTEGWQSAEQRFLHHRERLLKRGIASDSIEPEWCYQNEGSCYLLNVDKKG